MVLIAHIIHGHCAIISYTNVVARHVINTVNIRGILKCGNICTIAVLWFSASGINACTPNHTVAALSAVCVNDGITVFNRA